MKNSKPINTYLFWSIISIMIIAVISITSIAYFQFKLGNSVSVNEIQTGTMYTVVHNTKSLVWLLGISF
ncbi:MAG: hypothetical protein ACPGLV_09550 [Bacteroidia bacterium]